MESQEFGTRLRELRKQAGLSQRELADKIGVNFTYLSKIESGVLPPPSEKVIVRLAEVLNVDKDELMLLAGKIPSDIAQILKNREALQLLRSDRTQKKIEAGKNKERKSIMKGLMSYRRFSRVVVAVVLVCAVAASLWFIAPTPTKALNISFPSLPSSGTLGSTYSFTVKVDIRDTELLPIQSINLDIYNSANPTTYKATCTNLPLIDGGTKNYSSADTGGGGTVSVTATAANWGWGYGYGYALWEKTTTPYYFGYGYGYGYGAGAASIEYTVAWTPPSGWPQGSYKIEAEITANGRTFTQPSSAFTLSRPPAVGVGVGAPPAGITYVSGYVTSACEFVSKVTAKSADGNVKLIIEKGVVGKTKPGRCLSRISILVMEKPPVPPANASIIGLTYDIGPDEATFDPPVTLIFTYDADEIPEGVNEEDLVIAWWDEAAEEWVELVGRTVDPETDTITAPVSHFTAFTILAYTQPANFITRDLTISPAEVDIGRSVTISALITNIGDLAGSYKITLKIENVAVATKDVTLAGGASQKVTFTTTQDIAGTYTIDVDGLSGIFTVKTPPPPPPAPAAFATTDLTIFPTEVEIGGSVTISVLVTNTGELAGSYEVILKIDNIVVASKDVTLTSGASQKVTFTTAQDVAETYTVDVDGLSGTFTVKMPAPLEVVPAKPSISWWLIGGIIFAAALVIGLVIWLVGRRRMA